jgi:hypothetical protein
MLLFWASTVEPVTCVLPTPLCAEEGCVCVGTYTLQKGVCGVVPQYVPVYACLRPPCDSKRDVFQIWHAIMAAQG